MSKVVDSEDKQKRDQRCFHIEVSEHHTKAQSSLKFFLSVRVF